MCLGVCFRVDTDDLQPIAVPRKQFVAPAKPENDTPKKEVHTNEL